MSQEKSFSRFGISKAPGNYPNSLNKLGNVLNGPEGLLSAVNGSVYGIFAVGGGHETCLKWRWGKIDTLLQHALVVSLKEVLVALFGRGKIGDRHGHKKEGAH